MKSPSCFFCAIGGSGMSALAYILRQRGWDVSGSDRSFDQGEGQDLAQKLKATGISLFPQDGSGITEEPEMVVYSTAVEETIPDIKEAKVKEIPLKHRATLLAELFHQAPKAIAIAGTSGKSTVTAMTGVIFSVASQNPTIVNGAVMNNFITDQAAGNAVNGTGESFIAEVDESDGSLELYSPAIGVLTNISLDHKPLPELQRLFIGFAQRSEALAVNADDPRLQEIARTSGAKKIITFGIEAEADLKADAVILKTDRSQFMLKDQTTGEQADISLPVPGAHNVSNALAAAAAARLAGISLEDIAKGLGAYQGLHRRYNFLGEVRGVSVIDDFAHNPDKIAATLKTVAQSPGRIIAVFQPHGFAPTKLLRADLVKSFADILGPDDLLLMPEIFYGGGTAQKDISSADLVEDVKKSGNNAFFFSERTAIISYLKNQARSGDRIIVMGARDKTLPLFARAILSALAEKTVATA